MKVKELIEVLKEINQEAIVNICDDSGLILDINSIFFGSSDNSNKDNCTDVCFEHDFEKDEVIDNEQ